MDLLSLAAFAAHAASGAAERAAAPWADTYNAHPALQTTVAFAHVGSLLVGGGFALATDRATLRTRRAGEALRRHFLDELHAVHRPVLIGLAVACLSGVLLFAADVKTFLGSPVYWVKLALVALLLVNGWRMTRTEAALRADPAARPLWGRLQRIAVASMALWLAVALAGTILVNAA